ncbi:MAG: hypothetical protein RLZZ176_636 [Cyanobacteriota bacterium]
MTDVVLSQYFCKNSGEVKRSPTSVSNLSLMDTINKRSRGSGYKRALWLNTYIFFTFVAAWIAVIIALFIAISLLVEMTFSDTVR